MTILLLITICSNSNQKLQSADMIQYNSFTKAQPIDDVYGQNNVYVSSAMN